MESTGTNRVWKKGPPPHVGWWNASASRSHGAWRWWNGKRWSTVCYTMCERKMLERNAVRPFGRDFHIEWTDYWPEGARVPRLEGEWTFHHGDAGPAPGRIVDIVLRSGRQCTGLVESWSWDHTTPATSREYDIVAWRFA